VWAWGLRNFLRADRDSVPSKLTYRLYEMRLRGSFFGGLIGDTPFVRGTCLDGISLLVG